MWLCSLKSLWNSGNILACAFPEWTGALISQYMDAFLIPWQWTWEHHEIVLRSSWQWRTESLYKDSCCPPKSSNFFFFFLAQSSEFFFLIPTADKPFLKLLTLSPVTCLLLTVNFRILKWSIENRNKDIKFHYVHFLLAQTCCVTVEQGWSQWVKVAMLLVVIQTYSWNHSYIH